MPVLTQAVMDLTWEEAIQSKGQTKSQIFIRETTALFQSSRADRVVRMQSTHQGSGQTLPDMGTKGERAGEKWLMNKEKQERETEWAQGRPRNNICCVKLWAD